MEQILPVSREDLEQQHEFLGFLIMSNQLKPDTAESIEILAEAGIRNVMITGDNALTAINVARTCGIFKQDSKVYLSVVDKGLCRFYFTKMLIVFSNTISAVD